MANRKITYRLYPTAAQAARLHQILVLHQRLYNAALEQRISAYALCGHSVSFAEQCANLTELRAEFPEYAALNAQSEQVTLKRVDLAFKAFFRRVKEGSDSPGFPRFKSVDRFSGWGYKTHGDGWRLIAGEGMRHGKLRLSGIGEIAIRGGARTPGEPKTCEIMRKGNQWYASVTIDCEPQRERGILGVGLDWGVDTFATLEFSNGATAEIANPRHTKSAAQELARAQRGLARKKKGSRNRQRAKAKVARTHAKTANRRKEFLHQQTALIIALCCLIATEQLKVKAMTASGKGGKRGLNREILSTSPAAFLQLLQTKAAEAGCEFVEIPTRTVKPSQTCPNCGRRRKKTLSERVHDCECGLRTKRDRAAARVNLNWALTGKPASPGWEPTGSVWSGCSLAVMKHESPPITANAVLVE